MSGTGGQISNFLGSIPLVTRLVVGINLCVYVYIPLLYTNPGCRYCLCPFFILDRLEFDRLITPAFFHAGFAHVAMNMLATLFIMMNLEQKFGSLCMLGQVILFTLLESSLYTLIYWVGLFFTSNHYWLSCSVGFSGVIFSLLMVETALLPAGASRSLCGFCNIPAWTYPWILLVLLSVLLPNVSFVGHLAGLLMGWCYSKGLLSFLTLKREWIQAFESKSWMEWIVESPIYAKCHTDDLLPNLYGGSTCAELLGCGFLGTVCNSVARACAGCCALASSRVTAMREGVADARSIRRQQRNPYERVGVADQDSQSDDDFVVEMTDFESDHRLPLADVESEPIRPSTGNVLGSASDAQKAATPTQAKSPGKAKSPSSSSGKGSGRTRKERVPPQGGRRPHHNSRLLQQ